jgi:CRISPR/Cas system-associated endonuclease Cas1
MIKRTLYFGNPAYLKTINEQLVFESVEDGELKALPIEDISVLIMNGCKICVRPHKHVLHVHITQNVSLILRDLEYFFYRLLHSPTKTSIKICWLVRTAPTSN